MFGSLGSYFHSSCIISWLQSACILVYLFLSSPSCSVKFIYLSPGLSVSYFLIYSDISRLVCVTVLIFYSHWSHDKKFLIMLLPATPSFTAGRYSRWICMLDFRICVFSWSWPGIFHVLGKCVSLLYKTVALFAFEEDSWGKTILNLVMAPNSWFYSPLWKRFIYFTELRHSDRWRVRLDYETGAAGKCWLNVIKCQIKYVKPR